MKRRFSMHVAAAFAVVALGAAAGWAADEDMETPDGPQIETTCDVSGYKTESIKYDPAVAIPDGDTGGVKLGPLQFADDGKRISDTVLEIIASHTKIGDLTVELGYDLTCNGSIDYKSRVVCRPRGTQTTTPAPCGTGTGGGCTGDLSCGRMYSFRDAGASELAVGACAATLATGCYKPPTTGGTPLSVFKDLPKGGCWYLTIVDHVTPNKGSVCEWSVHLLNHVAVGVEAATWAKYKVLYR